MKSGLFASSEISTPVVLNVQSCALAAVSPTRAISTSTAYQILSLMISQKRGIADCGLLIPNLLAGTASCEAAIEFFFNPQSLLPIPHSPFFILPQFLTRPACEGRRANAPA